MIPAMRRALVAIALLAAAPAHAETRFLAAFDDIPLAPGLAEVANSAFAFAAAEGRIAESTATGREADLPAVRAWYAQALPALGWALQSDAGDLVFARGRERLTVTLARGSDGAATVRFRLVARPASLALD